MNATKLLIALSILNAALLLLSFTRLDAVAADDGAAVLRGRALEIVDDRYQRRSTIVTSQIPVKQWHAAIGEPTLADAILDRLVHNAYKIAMSGKSMRDNPKLTPANQAK